MNSLGNKMIQSPAFNICDCCRVEFGYKDCNLKAIHAFRKKWLEEGKIGRANKKHSKKHRGHPAEMKDKVQLLIDILLDKTAREDERGDAAIDLRMYKDVRALEALAQVTSDPNEDIVIVDNCAESIGEICVGMDLFNENSFRKMIPFAQKIVFGFIMYHKPELINETLRIELAKKFNL
jgi:hypothetical protein